MADDLASRPRPTSAAAAQASAQSGARSEPPMSAAAGASEAASAPGPGPQVAPEAAPAPQPQPGPAVAPAHAAAATGEKPKSNTRARLFTGLAAAVLIGGLIYGTYYVLVASHFVSTDDAYVGADTAQVTPQVSGQVLEVRVSDTQAVKAGDVLVVIDPADARLSEAQAEAEYGRAVRRVQQNFATNGALDAQVAARDADLARAKAQLSAAQSDLERTQLELKRRQALAASGAVSGEELSTARSAAQTAQANLDATKAAGGQAVANRAVALSQAQAQAALTNGASVEQNPEVVAAKAMLDTAKLNLTRTVIRAPVDGVVAKRNVQIGQRIAVGANLLTIAPIATAYVDANFKEVQLRKVKPGQSVELKSDLYGSKVKFHGHVVGFAGGTGAAFAVIPAQNATGNWIKVVQRLPVRVALDPKELQAHPLRVGSSMETKIDLRGGDTQRTGAGA
ncbi:multidrug efflux MFS transporter adaptor subunit VceA [soil metagenome]